MPAVICGAMGANVSKFARARPVPRCRRLLGTCVPAGKWPALRFPDLRQPQQVDRYQREMQREHVQEEAARHGVGDEAGVGSECDEAGGAEVARGEGQQREPRRRPSEELRHVHFGRLAEILAR